MIVADEQRNGDSIYKNMRQPLKKMSEILAEKFPKVRFMYKQLIRD